MGTYGYDIKDGVYREDWLDYDDELLVKHQNHAETYLDSDGEVHVYRGAVNWHKTRGQIGREEWMCQQFGDDWRTNGRVATGVDVNELRPRYHPVEWIAAGVARLEDGKTVRIFRTRSLMEV